MALKVVEVAVFGVPETLYYYDEFDTRVGELVSVEVRGHVARGVVVSHVDNPSGLTYLKPILVSEGIWIDEDALQIARWMAQYYVSNLWEVLRLFFPPGTLQSEKRLIKLDRRALSGYGGELTEREKRVIEKLSESRGWLNISSFSRREKAIIESLIQKGLVREKAHITPIKERFLDELTSLRVEFDIPDTPQGIYRKLLNRVQGTTLLSPHPSFDRYPLYFYLVHKYMDMGKDVVIITPDLHGIPYMARLLMDAFGERVGVYHSGFSEAVRTGIWMEVFRGNKRIIVGTPSALFLPYNSPGLIIVDDEHDYLYKNESRRPYYHARDVAVYMGKKRNMDVLLYSATPSLESIYNSMKGKYRMLRVSGEFRSRVSIVDIRKKKFTSPLEPSLMERMKEEVMKGNQVLVLINRRGFSRSLICRDRGYTMMCRNCSLPLFFHRSDGMMHCHICGYREPPMEVCPRCGSTNIKPAGYGTERVHEYLSRIFPGKVVRLDSDVMRRRKQMEDVLNMIYSGKASIVVGTNVITRSLKLDRVTMAVVLLADLGMLIPDFRSTERIAQNLLQLRGRLSSGVMYVQTYHPDSEVMEAVRSGNYMDFAGRTLLSRKEFHYPPYVRMTMIEYQHGKKERAELGMESVLKFLQNRLPDDVELIGPAPPPVERLRGKYRIRLFLKYQDYRGINPLLHELSRMDDNVRIIVDPYDFF